MINFMRFRWLYFLISTLVILPGLVSIALWGLKLSIDFTGGTVLELRLNPDIGVEQITDVKKSIDEKGYPLNSIQSSGEQTYLFRLKTISRDDAAVIKETIAEKIGGEVDELRFETVGPILGRELVVKTLIAIGLAAVFILGYVAWAFKEPRFGICAILAMFHDSLVLLGSFSLLGHFFGAEVDTLFVTALLTVLSFSVHDTVVVYDRIRESQRKLGGIAFTDLANKAVTETLSRSLNNSLTIIFMLLTLLLLGGETIKWFAAALLIGTISGTYSSPFTAVPLLTVWEKIRNRKK